MHRIGLAAIVSLAAMAMSAQHAVAEGAGYVPRLGEIMTLLQIRHAKLWFAGNAQNWELAAFEMEEIKEGFEDVAKYHPKSNDVVMGPVVEALNGNELVALEKAIEARDRGRFRAAYDRLTGSCNACHQVTRHGFIVIQRPKGVPMTNQAYAPARTRGTKAKSGR